ncbi:MAG TPA: hypothetical protein VKQ29_16830, partial [Aliidongia sp.]|nr:hypothetical protein [Aliidongia sp.]
NRRVLPTRRRLRIPSNSNNVKQQPAFFTNTLLRQQRRHRQRRQAFTLASEPSQQAFLLFFASFSSCRQPRSEAFDRSDQRYFPRPETKRKTRVALVPFPDFSRRRLAF